MAPGGGRGHARRRARRVRLVAGGSGRMAERRRRAPAPHGAAVAVSAFTALKYGSFTHSAVYTALLIAAFTGGETLALGWIHGIGWIVMSVACLVAARLRVIPIRVAVAVVV